MSRQFILSSFARTVVASAAIGLLVACSATMPTEKADKDFVEVERGNFDHVLMRPNEPLAKLSRVSIAEPVVAMSDYWLRDHRNDYSERDLQRIKEDYARALKQALTDVLTNKSLVEVVEAPEQAEVVIRPSLRDLNIYAPDFLTLPARTDQYVEVAGNATLNLEFVDPRSNRVLAQFVDHRETPAIVIGSLEETNRVTNFRLFRRLMERWSNNLAQYLYEQGLVVKR